MPAAGWGDEEDEQDRSAGREGKNTGPKPTGLDKHGNDKDPLGSYQQRLAGHASVVEYHASANRHLRHSDHVHSLTYQGHNTCLEIMTNL